MFKELLEFFTKQFIKRVGRDPQTPAEMMSIQNDVVRYLNKTKGDPKKLTPQSMINERYRAANPFLGFKPTVIQGGKSKEGITSIPVDEQFTTKRIHKIDDELDKLVLKEGKYGKMNRTDRENERIRLQDESSTLQKTPGVAEGKFNDEFRSFKLNIAKNNPEFNQDLAKQVINRERFKDATTEQRKQVLDALEFVLKNPEGLASGGLARAGYGKGKLVKWLSSLGKKPKPKKPLGLITADDLEKSRKK